MRGVVFGLTFSGGVDVLGVKMIADVTSAAAAELLIVELVEWLACWSKVRFSKCHLSSTRECYPSCLLWNILLDS